MDPRARRKAQQRVDRIGAFRVELAELEREEVLTLTEEQRSRLDSHLQRLLAGLTAHFDVDVTESSKRISWGVRIAALLGGAAFCAALVLFLDRIWGALPPVVHAVILLAIPLLATGAAELTHRRKAGSFSTALLVLAASAGFIVGLSVLGSVFNVAPTPHALLAWGVFAALVAYAYGLRVPLGAALLLLCAYSASLAVTVEGADWASFLMRPESLLPAGVVTYAVPSVVGRLDRNEFGFVYRLCGALATFTALLLLSVEGHFSRVPLAARTVETLYQVAGLVLSSGVVFHGVRQGWSGLVNLGALAFVIFLSVKLHAWWWSWMPKYLFFLLLGLTAVLLLDLFRRLRARLPERAVP